MADEIFDVVSRSTGEIADTLSEGDRIVHKKKDNKKSDVIYDYSKKRHFIKIYVEVNELRKKLTQSEFCIAMSLCDWVCYEDFLIRHNGNRNGNILSIRELSAEMGVGYDNLRKIINSLISKQVLGVHKTGNKQAITVNPYIYSRGNNVNKTILDLFEHSEWKWKDK